MSQGAIHILPNSQEGGSKGFFLFIMGGLFLNVLCSKIISQTRDKNRNGSSSQTWILILQMALKKCITGKPLKEMWNIPSVPLFAGFLLFLKIYYTEKGSEMGGSGGTEMFACALSRVDFGLILDVSLLRIPSLFIEGNKDLGK